MLFRSGHNQDYPRLTYFFCARNEAEQERSVPEHILRCLVRQLSIIPGGCALHKALKSRFDTRFEDGDLSLEQAKDIALKIINNRPLTYIIIDALDECDANQRDQLLEALQSLLSKSSSLVKILTTCREDRDLVDLMSIYPHIEIDATKNAEDIRRFVKYSVDDLIRRKKLLRTQGVSNELKSRIIKTLCDGAQGM